MYQLLVSYLIMSLASIALAQPSQLPSYPEENLIPKDQVPIYKEALSLNLKQQNLHNCNTDINVTLGRYLSNYSSNGDFFEEFYLFPGDQPLIVIMVEGNLFYRIEITTDHTMTQITNVEVTGYEVTTTRVNKGSLEKPEIIDQNLVDIQLSRSPCYQELL